MKAYKPRQSTRNLITRILRQDGIVNVTLIAPQMRRTIPPMLRVGLESGSYTDFTLPEAREWLETETEKALRS